MKHLEYYRFVYTVYIYIYECIYTYMYKSTSDLYWCHRTETLSKIRVHFEPFIPGLIRDARDIIHRS